MHFTYFTKKKRECAGTFLFLNIYSGRALVCVSNTTTSNGAAKVRPLSDRYL